MESINLKVNGIQYQFNVDKSSTLIQILRDRLDLTGTKLACGYGKCGACTVVMNGKAIRSCVTKATKTNGAEILTIEGLEKDYSLHPIQQAFIEAYAVQCGFCTPGIIMTLYALLTSNPAASADEVRNELNEHLCRCTGYENILKAALLAREKMQGLGVIVAEKEEKSS